MFEVFWKKHYHPGLTGSFHGDMAAAFDAIRNDPDAKYYPDMLRKLRRSVELHISIELDPAYTGGRLWFFEIFGKNL